VQNRVTGISFKGAIFTNLSRDHLDYHGTEEAYGAAKELLFHAAGLQFAVINLDDSFGMDLATRLVGTGPCIIGTTLNRDLAAPSGVEVLRAENLVASAKGLQFDVTGHFGCAHIRTALLGRFNAANLLQVLAAALMSGLSLDEAGAGLSALHAPQGRLEYLGGQGAPTVVIDYAHTPDALEKALSTLRDTMSDEQKLFCVMGCGGNRDAGKRPLMGAVAARLANHVILTSDNPRLESVDAILDDIAAGISGAYERIADRAQAIGYAIAHAKPQDVVLIAGKGHEQYQDIAGQKFEFSDRAVAETCLAGGRS
jgi:UDP-N-acetylmuramoyl-L-alanyl-D-glutamate--2,6-diaminopimelate ligase